MGRTTNRAADRQVEELVDALLGVTGQLHRAVNAVAARAELTAQQVVLLRILDHPVSMRAFADELACDPSNVTGLIDRVERRGLVERVPDPADRRVRLLVLTDEGRSLRDEIGRELAAEIDASWHLTDAQVTTLLAATSPLASDD